MNEDLDFFKTFKEKVLCENFTENINELIQIIEKIISSESPQLMETDPQNPPKEEEEKPSSEISQNSTGNLSEISQHIPGNSPGNLSEISPNIPANFSETSNSENPEKKFRNDQIESLVTNEEQSTKFVKFLREITAQTLQKNEIFSSFLPEGQTIEKVSQVALTMGEDAEQLQMMSLLMWVNIGCQVFQLDREKGNALYKLPDETIPPRIYLLFRPGHYDLLYKNNNS